MTFSNVRAYLSEQQVIHKAKALYRRRGLAVVAYAMFRLNRTAQPYPRGFVGKDRIYDLKNRFVEHLYRGGYCVSAKQHNQNFECWDCDGKGVSEWYDGDECPKCNGTGIYRSIPLYLFRFQIGDQFYSWHQPVGLVTWNVELTDDAAGDYEPRPEKHIIPLRGHRLNLCLALVYVYLKEQGAPPRATPKSFLRSLYLDTIAYPLHELETDYRRFRYRCGVMLFDAKLHVWERRHREQDQADSEAYADYLESQYESDRAHRLEQAIDAAAYETDPDLELPF